MWDSEGREYLDFFPGWGCNLLGHCPPRIVEAVQQQVATLIHVPNTWHMQSQGLWAQMLVERCFDGQAFFCNSGAEANEAAIKLAQAAPVLLRWECRSATRSLPFKVDSTGEPTVL